MGNPTSNEILERIHQILGNLVHNFNITQTYANRLKGYIPVQLVFGCDMILPIKHKVDRELICHQKQRHINKDNIRENIKIVDHNYKVGDKVILNNHAA